METEEKLRQFNGDVEFLTLTPLVSFLNATECKNGGRRAKGRVKPHAGAGCNPCRGAVEVLQEHKHHEVVTYATQDEWEEYVPHCLVCPFANPFDEEDELPGSPVLEFRLND